MIRRKRKPRKNPILHVINGVRYEIKNTPIYDESRLIKDFSKLIDLKFPQIKNKIPLIIFENIQTGENGVYYYVYNEIGVHSKLESNQLRVLFHELGHFTYQKYLDSNSINYFNNYVSKQTKQLNILKLKELLKKYGLKDLSLKFPLVYTFIVSLRFTVWFDVFIERTRYDGPIDTELFLNLIDFIISLSNSNKEIFFTKPASAYMPDDEEIFCEIFANYMMYDKRLLHTDNYVILKEILPELR